MQENENLLHNFYLTIYNRKNEMYNFSKRNVQFSRFFAPCKKAT